MNRTNVAYCAKGPVGHGRTLLLHIAHGGKLRISSSSGRVVLLLPVEEANSIIQGHRYVKSRKEKMSLKENGRHVFLFGQLVSEVLGRLKRGLCWAWQPWQYFQGLGTLR